MRQFKWSLCLLVASLAPGIFAQSPVVPAEDPAHAELRTLRDEFVGAFNKSDMEGMLNYVRDNVVFTALSGEVCHGKDPLRAYYAKMMKGPNPIVRDIKVELAVDQIADLYGSETAIAWGGIVEKLSLTSGLSFSSNDRWSATLVKENGKWLIASLHISCDIFDNPLLNAAKKSAYVVGLVAALIGLIAGFLISRLMRPKAAVAISPRPQNGA